MQGLSLALDNTVYEMSKNMQELLAEELNKYTVTAHTNDEKLIKAQSFVDK